MSQNGLVLARRIELLPRHSLVAYSRNARTHSAEQIAKIAASIVEFGFTNPILIDRETIIAGHGRLEAAVLLDLPEVPVIVLDHLTPTQKRAYILADNRLALDAGWDEELLAGELEALNEEGYDLALTGFNEAEIAGLLAEPEAEGGSGDADAAPAPPAVAITLPGDLWLLGSHRVLCGDATNLGHVERLAAGEKLMCLWTDPPYNVDYVGKTADALKISNDSKGAPEFFEFLRASLTNACAVMKPGASAYIAHADTEGINFRTAFIAAGFKLASCLIWRKNVMVLGHSDYHWQHEPILYGWRGDGSHRWFGARNKTTIAELPGSTFQQVGPNEWQLSLGEQTLIISGEDLMVETAAGSVFYEEKPSRNAEHPTMKPVALIERMLSNSSETGDPVLDLFGGSGSTLIACQRLKRRARLLELEPRYCDVIVRRWQDFTGKEATLERTGESFNARSADAARG